MKKPTKQELMTERERLTKDNCVLMQALNHLMRGEFERIGKAHNYTVQLAGATLAHGGIILTTFAPSGQQPYTSAHYLDDAAYCQRVIHTCVPSDEEAIAYRDLVFKAETRRNELVRKETEAA